VGTFGIGSAAYWWARLAAIGARTVLYIQGRSWLWQLLYADDFLWYASGDHPFDSLVLSILLLRCLGFPFAWRKFRGGFQLSWIGFWADLTTWQVGLSDQRARWVTDWLEEFMGAEQVCCRRVAEGLGRLSFAVSAVGAYKPFLGPWFAWVAATRYGATVDVPVGLRIIAKFLKDRIQHDSLRADARLCVEGEPPPVRPHPDFRADAKAEGDEVVLGGWLSKDGCPASKALSQNQSLGVPLDLGARRAEP
jgi:hypothetical protein